MSQKFERPNPVSEDYETLFEEVGRSDLAPLRQKAVAKVGVKMGRELTEALKEFSRTTQRLGRVNLALTFVIAVATAIYAWVAWVTR